MSARSTPRLAALVVLFALPLALRLFPIRHGLPRNYVPDTHVVRSALGMAKDKDLAPPVGKYSYYPNLLPYLLLPIYAAHYSVGKAHGEWTDAKSYGDYLLDHPEAPHALARYLIALFGALTPWVVYRAARTAGLARGAWVSAWLVATGLLHVQFSVQERPWIPVAFFMALSAWGAAAYAKSGRFRALAASGAAAGLAAAAHQAGIPALGIAGLAWLFGPRAWRGRDLALRAAEGAFTVVVFAAVALVAGHLYLVRHGWTSDSQTVLSELSGVDDAVSVGGQSFVFGLRAASLARLARALVGYDPVVLVLGLAGLVHAFRERALRPLCAFLVVWAAVFMTNPSDHVRYLLPVTLFLAWPAGVAAERWMASGRARVLLWIVLALPLVQAARFDCVVAREDTRAEAERRLAEFDPTLAIAIDRYGPDVDLDREAVYRVVRLKSSKHQRLSAREERRKFLLDRGVVAPEARGVNAVRVEDLFEIDVRRRTISVRSGLESLGTDARSVLANLGIRAILLVERRPERGESNTGRSDWNPLRELVQGREPRWVIDPSTGGALAPEAFLPTEMDFPLTALWCVDRPGPWLGLFEL